MSPSLVVLPGRTGRSVVHPFGDGWTTVAKSARATGVADLAALLQEAVTAEMLGQNHRDH